MFTIATVLSTVKAASKAFKIYMVDAYRQSEVSTLHLQEQSVLVSGTSFWSKHKLPGVHLPGAHCSGLSPSSRDIANTLSLGLVSLPPRPSGTFLPPIKVITDTENGRLQTKFRQIGTGISSGHSVSRCSTMSRSRQTPIPKLGDSSTNQPFLSFHQVSCDHSNVP